MRIMIGEIEAHFRDFATKSGEMKELIGQSGSVLQQSITRMNQIIDGSLRGVNLRLEQNDMAF